MAGSLYITAVEWGAGKTLVVLGVMDLLARNVARLGFFRPVVPAKPEQDDHIRLMSRRFELRAAADEMYGITADRMHQLSAAGRLDELLQTVEERFLALKSKCDFVVCDGTDFSGAQTPFEFALNSRLAARLNCPIMAVLYGDKSSAEIVETVLQARETLTAEGGNVRAFVVNKCRRVRLEETAQLLKGRTAEPVYLIPEEPFLRLPNMFEIKRALNARRVYGNENDMTHDIRGAKIAAMNVSNFLSYVEEGDLIITPADRSDIILGAFTALRSDAYPPIAGLLLTGNVDTPPTIIKLIKGMERVALPVLKVSTDTYRTAMAVNNIRTAMTPENEKRNLAALALFEKSVDQTELKKLLHIRRSAVVTPLMFEFGLIERCREKQKHIVLCEGEDERILRAAENLMLRDAVRLTLLGKVEAVKKKIDELGLRLRHVPIIDPSEAPQTEEFARTYLELRRHKGVTEQMAFDMMTDVSYFGTMMVYKGLADGMVSGAAHPAQHTVRPALEFIKTKSGTILSSVTFMCLADRVLVYADCAVNADPNEEELAEIALQSAETARLFGIEPRVAMLSYAAAAGQNGEADRVREATRIARERRPDLLIDGPFSYDVALDAGVAVARLPGSKVAGRATVLIFPDLNRGINTCKAVQRSAGATVIGPILQGLRRPVNHVNRTSTAADIVNIIAITAVQAQGVEEDV